MLAQAQSEGTVSSVSYVADEYLGPTGSLRPDVGLLPYVQLSYLSPLPFVTLAVACGNGALSPVSRRCALPAPVVLGLHTPQSMLSFSTTRVRAVTLRATSGSQRRSA